MIWMVVSVLGVLLMGASVLGMLLVVSPGVRMFCLGAVCMLGVVGVLFSLAPQHTMQEKTRQRHASGEQRSGTPGTPAAPTAQARPEAVSTPAEAAQAVQRLRAAHDAGRQGHGEPPARAMLQADVRPPPDIIAPPSAPTVPAPGRQAALASEAHDALADALPAPALLAPRGAPIPRITVLPPSSLPPREAPVPAAAPPPAETATPPAPTVGRGLKVCDELKAEIQAKFAANHMTDAALTIIASGALPGHHIVGSCEGGTKQIVLHRTQGGP